MYKNKSNYFVNLLKATRVIRTIIPLSSIMLVVGFTNKITLEILILMICCILIYAAGGILNAKSDKDFALKHPLKIVVLLSLLAFFIASYNYIIFLAVISWVLLSFIYNKFSRFVIFGDSIVLSITHSTIPIVSASVLLNLNAQIIMSLSGFMFFAFFFIVPIKNLIGVKEDKKRKYKTLLTEYKNGKRITQYFLNIHIGLLFLTYFIFNLGNKFLLIFFPILIIGILMNYLMKKNKKTKVYALSRLIFLLFSFAIVYDKTTDYKLPLASATILLIYARYLFKTIKN